MILVLETLAIQEANRTINRMKFDNMIAESDSQLVISVMDKTVA